MLTAAKSSLEIWRKFSDKSMIRKIFEGEMFLKTLPTTFLQIVCKFIFNTQVIGKSIMDGTRRQFLVNFSSMNGLTWHLLVRRRMSFDVKTSLSKEVRIIWSCSRCPSVTARSWLVRFHDSAPWWYFPERGWTPEIPRACVANQAFSWLSSARWKMAHWGDDRISLFMVKHDPCLLLLPQPSSRGASSKTLRELNGPRRSY